MPSRSLIKKAPIGAQPTGAKNVLYLVIIVDTASLARKLNISITALRKRAQALGLVPEEVSAGRGRPKQIWSEAQAEELWNYGQISDSVNHEDWIEDSEVSGQMAVVSAQSEIAMVLQNQLTAFDTQCEILENKLAEALAARASVVPARSWQKTSDLLRSGAMGVDMAGFGAIALTPRAKSLAADRFPESV